jgi:hypothetical protein
MNTKQRLSESVSSYIKLCKKVSLKVKTSIIELTVVQTVIRKLSKTEENKR